MLDLLLCLAYFPIVSFTRAYKEATIACIGHDNLKNSIILYNGAMSAFSLLEAVGALRFRFFVEGPVEDCGAGVYASDPYYAAVVWLFFASKYIEWLDTVFLILKDKPTSILHRLHHVGAPVAVGLLWHSRAPFAWLFIALNGTVHFFMYGYYLLCLLGKGPRWARPWITRGQIAQFLSGFLIFWVRYSETAAWGTCGLGQQVAFWYQYAYVGVVLLLFANFYLVNYLGEEAKKKNKTAAAPEKGVVSGPRVFFAAWCLILTGTFLLFHSSSGVIGTLGDALASARESW